MLRRWIIRGVLLGLPVLCMGAWGLTYGYFISLWGYGRADGYVLAQRGSIYIGWFDSPSLETDWHFYFAPLLSNFHYDIETSGLRFLGFVNGTFTGGVSTVHFIGIPFWFPTLMLSLITIYAWRKTSKSKALRAFPVEIKKPSEISN